MLTIGGQDGGQKQIGDDEMRAYLDFIRFRDTAPGGSFEIAFAPKAGLAHLQSADRPAAEKFVPTDPRGSG